MNRMIFLVVILFILISLQMDGENATSKASLGSIGPIIGDLFERWAKITGRYYVYPTQYEEFNIIRGITNRGGETGDIIIVDDSGGYHSIQTAVEHAHPGDVILVYNGTYREYIVIDKPLWIIGVRKGEKDREPTIEWDGKEYVFQIQGVNVTIYGFRVEAVNAFNINSSNSYVCRNTIFMKEKGIIIKRGSNSTIKWNKLVGVTSKSIGVTVEDSEKMKIEGNYIEKVGIGLLLNKTRNSILKYNSIVNSSYGIWLNTSTDNIIFYNNFINNEINAYSKTIDRNNWSYNEKGNYWSDYSGVDEDENGVGDTPYYSYNGIIDDYPLITRFTNKPPAKPLINPDERGVLCGKRDTLIPFYFVVNDDDKDEVYYKWLWGEEESKWKGPAKLGIPLEEQHQWSSRGDNMVTEMNIYLIVKDQHGWYNVSDGYKIHLYDLTSLRSRLMRNLLDKLLPTYFLSGWN